MALPRSYRYDVDKFLQAGLCHSGRAGQRGLPGPGDPFLYRLESISTDCFIYLYRSIQLPKLVAVKSASIPESTGSACACLSAMTGAPERVALSQGQMKL
jgi:hypothetical protein